MRNTLVIVCFCVMLSGCGLVNGDGIFPELGDNSCADSLVVGQWDGTFAGHTDTLSVARDCTATLSYCGANFAFPKVTSAVGMTVWQVVSSNKNPGCPTPGPFSCTYLIEDEDKLNLSCGGISMSYSRP